MPTETLEEYMSPQVLAVTADSPLLSAARKICQHHVHRLIVVDADNRVRGIISTMDFVAAVVNAADEAEAALSRPVSEDAAVCSVFIIHGRHTFRVARKNDLLLVMKMAGVETAAGKQHRQTDGSLTRRFRFRWGFIETTRPSSRPEAAWSIASRIARSR